MSEVIRTTHLIMNISGCDDIVIVQNHKIREKLLDAVKKAGAKVIGVYDHEFEPWGYTCVILISESHASIHTYPEYRSAFIDFYTCDEKIDHYKFVDEIVKFFKPSHCEFKIIERVL